MTSVERSVAGARRRARTDCQEAGRQLRIGRVARGWSQVELARRCGMSASQVGRIERGEQPRVTVDDVARMASAVGLTVRVKVYPGPDPTVDAGQLAVIRRLRTLVPPGVRIPLEVGLPIEGDQRAWDGMLRDLVPDQEGSTTLAFDVETRFVDAQAQLRRVMLKARDSGGCAVLMVLADTDSNRRAVRSVRDLVRSNFPVSARAALQALREGRHPGGSALVFL